MRLIGNKTKLLPHIEELLKSRGFTGGTLIDIFSGTSTVGRRFKELGFRVIANDHLSAGYTQAVAGVEVSRHPLFERLERSQAALFGSAEFRRGLRNEGELDFGAGNGEARPRRGRPRSRRMSAAAGSEAAGPLSRAVHFLDRWVAPREGLIFRNFCPGGPEGRMYFRDQHGRKIDGILEFLRRAHQEKVLDQGELHLLLSALIDGADRVANISGTYGAYLKRWQTNTAGEMALPVPKVVESSFRNQAHQEDSNRLIRKIEGDVLYIDPPYNHRQYGANYHVLEIIAEHHRIPDLAAYERLLYGKTGLRPYRAQKSLYCLRPGPRHGAANALTAMSDLVLSARVRAVVVSYNEEGLLSRDEIGAILARFSGRRSFDFTEDLVEVECRRFRSDADRAGLDGKGGRSYRVVAGKERDRIGELLFFAARGPSRRPARGRPAGAAWSST
jgi:adenine-specific DNA-methyltransferase